MIIDSKQIIHSYVLIFLKKYKFRDKMTLVRFYANNYFSDHHNQMWLSFFHGLGIKQSTSEFSQCRNTDYKTRGNLFFSPDFLSSVVWFEFRFLVSRNQLTQNFESAKGCFVHSSQVINVKGQSVFLPLEISHSWSSGVYMSLVMQCGVALCTLYSPFPFFLQLLNWEF